MLFQSIKSLRILAIATVGFSAAVVQGATDVTLAWSPNPEADIAGYQLCYGTRPGAHPTVVDSGKVTSAVAPGLTEGTTYYFVVFATNAAGLQSLPSNEIAYQVPAPPPPNIAPVAMSNSLATAQGTPLPITLAGADADGNTLTFKIASGPAHGTLSGTAPSLTYSPAANFSGSDAFTLLINDGSLDSNVATVNISVNALVLVPGSVANGSFESGFAGWVVTGSAFIESITSSLYSATDGVKLVSLNGHRTADLASDAVLSQVLATTAGATYMLEFDMGVTGSASGQQKLQVTADGAGNLLSQITSMTKAAGATAQWTANSFTFVADSAATTLSFRDISAVTEGIDTLLDNVRVTRVNGAPVATSSAVTTTEDSPLAIVLAGSDGDSDALSFSIVSSPVNGTLGGGTVDSTTATVAIMIFAVNDAPVALVDSAITDENSPMPITLAGTDVEGDPLTFTLRSGPAHGTLAGTAPNLTYQPAPGFNGSDAISFQVNDGQSDSVPATVSITVTPVNDAPLAFSKSVITAEDSPLLVRIAGTDGDGDALTFTVISGPANGTLVGTAPDLTYQPAANFNGSDAFSFQVNDGSVNSAPATVSIAVTPVNDAPLAAAKSVTTAMDRPLSIILAGTDPEDDSLSYSVVDGPSHGTLAGTAPDLTYSPEANFTGADQFTFRVNDGIVGSAPATVSITVNPASAPVFASPMVTLAATEDESFAGQLLASDVDAGDVLTFRKVSGPAWLTVSASGKLGGTPLNSDVGSGSCSVSVSDPSNLTALATLTITVANTNDAPVFAVKSMVYPAGNEKELYLGQSLASAATDPDAGDIITYSKVDGPAWLVIATSGGLSGTPPSGSTGTNEFTVRATDAAGASDDATLQIKINGNTLPLPWSMDRVGTGNLAGTASFSVGVYSIAGSGALGGKLDAANFGWQTLSGDGDITVRISKLSDTGTATRVGVMIRESLAANSRQAFIGVNNIGTFQWLRRTSTGGFNSTSTSKVLPTSTPWVRLVRTGNVFTSYKSANGTTWTKLGAFTMTLPANCYIGLSVSSGSNSVLNTSQFSDVTINP